MTFRAEDISGSSWTSTNGRFTLSSSSPISVITSAADGALLAGAYARFGGSSGQYFTKLYETTDDWSWLPRSSFTIRADVRIQDCSKARTALFGFFQDNGADEKGVVVGCHENALYFGVSTQSSLDYSGCAGSSFVGRWVKLEFVYDGASVSTKVDGATCSSYARSGDVAYPRTATYLTIGAYRDVDQDVPLRMDLRSLALSMPWPSPPPPPRPPLPPPPPPPPPLPPLAPEPLSIMTFRAEDISGSSWTSTNGRFTLSSSSPISVITSAADGALLAGAYARFGGSSGQYFTKLYETTDDWSWLPRSSFTIRADVRIQDCSKARTALFGFFQDNGADEKGVVVGCHENALYFGVSTQSSLDYSGCAGSSFVGRWVKLEFVYDGASVSTKVDGATCSSYARSGDVAYPRTATYLTIGAYRDVDQDVPLRMDLRSLSFLRPLATPSAISTGIYAVPPAISPSSATTHHLWTLLTPTLLIAAVVVLALLIGGFFKALARVVRGFFTALGLVPSRRHVHTRPLTHTLVPVRSWVQLEGMGD